MTTLREVRSRMQAMMSYIAALNGVDNALRGFEEGEARDAARKLGASLLPQARLKAAAALKDAIKAIDEVDNSEGVSRVAKAITVVRSWLAGTTLWDGEPAVTQQRTVSVAVVGAQNCGHCGARLYETGRTGRFVYTLTPTGATRYLVTGNGGQIVANDGDCDGPPLLFRVQSAVLCGGCEKAVPTTWTGYEFFE